MTTQEQQDIANAIAVQVDLITSTGAMSTDGPAIIDKLYDKLVSNDVTNMAAFGVMLDGEGVSVGHDTNDVMTSQGLCKRKGDE